jgi:hypothetical protein
MTSALLIVTMNGFTRPAPDLAFPRRLQGRLAQAFDIPIGNFHNCRSAADCDAGLGRC